MRGLAVGPGIQDYLRGQQGARGKAMVRKGLLLLKDRFGEEEEEEAMRSQLKETSKLPGREKQWRIRF